MFDDKNQAEFIDIINQYFYSMDSFSKYYVQLVQKEVGIASRNDRSNGDHSFLLNIIIRYLTELQKPVDRQDSEIISHIEQIIENDKLAKFMFDNLEVKDDQIISKDTYMGLLMQKFNNKNKILAEERKQLINSGILNIISTTEILVSSLLKHHLKYIHKDPEINRCSITLEELENLADELLPRHYVIDKKVEDIFFEKFEIWIGEFFSKCTRKKYSEYKRENTLCIKQIIEVYARRNIIVHNNSIVNTLYLSNLDSEFTKDLKYNQKLESTIDYFIERVNIFFKFGIELIELIFNKSFKDNDKEALLGLNDFGLNLIEAGHYSLAKHVFKDLLDSNFNSINSLANFNYYLSCKMLGEDTLVEKSLTVLFESQKDELSQQDLMAYYILLDHEDAVKVAIGFINSSNSRFAQVNIIERWPIFKLLEEKEEFIAYKDSIIYNKDNGERLSK